MGIRAGSLRHALAYQTNAPAADALGQLQPVWTTAATYRAEVRAPNGRELITAQQQQAVVTHVLTLRHPGFEFSPAGRFLEGATVYNVVACCDPDGRRRSLVVTASTDPTETP
jgi:SPP1 family predicted phage head-tail adaptor